MTGAPPISRVNGKRKTKVGHVVSDRMDKTIVVSVQRLARHRSPIPLLAFTPNQAVRSQLALCWGVETFLVPQVKHTDDESADKNSGQSPRLHG